MKGTQKDKRGFRVIVYQGERPTGTCYRMKRRYEEVKEAVGAGVGARCKREWRSMMVGNIIYLAGTSSAGKSSLAAVLQDVLPIPYLHVTLDAFTGMFPAAYVAVQPFGEPVPPRAYEGLVLRHETQDGRLRLDPHHSPAWERLTTGFRQCIRTLALAGNYLIVDDVLTTRPALQATLAALAGVPVAFVRVYCPPAELARREQARGDRLLGLAAWQRERIDAGMVYDLELDTSQYTPDECAQRVLQLIANPPVPSAFDRLRLALD